MKYNQYLKNKKKLCDKLVELTKCLDSQENISHGMEDIPKQLERWFSNFFKDICGLGIGSTFKANTLWATWHNRNATIKTYFRPEKVNPKWDFEGGHTVKDCNKYRVFLATHNLDADTDMSDDDIMYIEYFVDANYKILYHSLRFE